MCILHVVYFSLFTVSVKMSLYRWLKHDKPSSSSDDATNKEVSKELGKSVSRKRGKYNHYDAEVKVKIAKYACENGNKAAVVRLMFHC